MRSVAVLLVAFVLVGCVSPEERARRDAAVRAQVEAQDDSTCRGFGAVPATDGYINCRMTLHQQRIQAAQNEAILYQRNNQNLMNSGLGILQMNQPRTIGPAHTNTTCQRVGNTVNCTTW